VFRQANLLVSAGVAHLELMHLVFVLAQYLMLVLLCDMVCMARPSEYYALFYDDAIAAKKSFLGCLCTYMRRSKPSDPKIIAAVSAIIHAWLGKCCIVGPTSWSWYKVTL